VKLITLHVAQLRSKLGIISAPSDDVVNTILPPLTGIKFLTWTYGIFVKNPETGRFLFLLAHILAYMVFAYLLPEVRNHP
jgi:hypothetical protein